MFNNIAELDERFDPRASCNEKNFFNYLCHLGKKMNKKDKKR